MTKLVINLHKYASRTLVDALPAWLQ